MTKRQQDLLERFAAFADGDRSDERLEVENAVMAALREIHWSRNEIARLKATAKVVSIGPFDNRSGYEDCIVLDEHMNPIMPSRPESG